MRAIDLTGQKFGRLTVIRFDGSRTISGVNKKRHWLVRCDCGTEKTVTSDSLRYGKTLSCGCLCREIVVALRTEHGHCRGAGGRKETPEYASWRAMRERCSNPDSVGFKNYGGRGITVCPEWRDDFIAFLRHMGPKPTPKHTIDRIDVNGNYEPGNVRWATRAEQTENRRPRVS